VAAHQYGFEFWGIRTADLGGHSGTREFTDEVMSRTRTKLEVWAAL
jgi:isocitrate/isopropylmalate dehydrogenase